MGFEKRRADVFVFFINGILSREEISELILKWARCINLNAREYPIGPLGLQMQSQILKLYVIFFFFLQTGIRRHDSDLTVSEFMHFFHVPGRDLISSSWEGRKKKKLGHLHYECKSSLERWLDESSEYRVEADQSECSYYMQFNQVARAWGFPIDTSSSWKMLWCWTKVAPLSNGRWRQCRICKQSPVLIKLGLASCFSSSS